MISLKWLQISHYCYILVLPLQIWYLSELSLILLLQDNFWGTSFVRWIKHSFKCFYMFWSKSWIKWEILCYNFILHSHTHVLTYIIYFHIHICVRSSFFCPQNMSKANKSKLELISSRNSYTPADIGAFHKKCFKRSK